MRKPLIFIIVASFFASSPVVVYAEENDVVSRSVSRRLARVQRLQNRAQPKAAIKRVRPSRRTEQPAAAPTAVLVKRKNLTAAERREARLAARKSSRGLRDQRRQRLQARQERNTARRVADAPGYSPSEERREMLILLNQRRQDLGRNNLQYHPILEQAAAEYVATLSPSSESLPEVNTEGLVARLQELGYKAEVNYEVCHCNRADMAAGWQLIRSNAGGIATVKHLLKIGADSMLDNDNAEEIGMARNGDYWLIVFATITTKNVLPDVDQAQAAVEVLEWTNMERAKVGLPPLTYNKKLEEAAIGHARDMNTRHYFDHNTPEGRTVEERIRATGYLDVDFATCNCRGYASNVGENIARGQITVQQVMEGWMNSPGHRENILKPEFKELGVGLVGNFWAQNFGRLDLK